MLRKILFPTDFSADSKRVKTVLKKMNTCSTGEIILFHILDERLLAYSEYIDSFAFGTFKVDKDIKKGIQRKLDEWKKDMENSGLKVSTKILSGTPFTTILSYSKQKKVSSIFLGHKGHRKIDNAMMGSTAEKIARKADMTVVLI